MSFKPKTRYTRVENAKAPIDVMDNRKRSLSTSQRTFRLFFYSVLGIMALLALANLPLNSALFVLGLLFIVFLSNYVRTGKLKKLDYDQYLLYVVKSKKRTTKVPFERIVRIDNTLKRIGDLDDIWFLEYEDTDGHLFSVQFLPKNLAEFVERVKAKNPAVRVPTNLERSIF